MHLHKHFRDRLVAALVHGEPLPVPVAGRAEFLKLGDNPSAVLFFPVPCALEEPFPAEIVLVDPLFLQLLDDLHLGGDGGVIRPRLPERVIALHPLVADQNVLHGIVKGMSHMKLPRDIRGRDYDGERCFRPVHLGVEIFFVQPFLV